MKIHKNFNVLYDNIQDIKMQEAGYAGNKIKSTGANKALKITLQATDRWGELQTLC